MTRTFAAALFALLAITLPAHAATIQWDFSGLSDNPVVVGGIAPDNLKFATVFVTGFFDYDTITDGLALNTFQYQVRENGNLVENCIDGNGCTLTINNNNLTLTSLPLPLFELTAPQPLDGEVPQMAGTDGFLFVIAPFGTTASGEFVEATPLPATLPLFASVLAGLGSIGWIRRKRAEKVSAA